MKTVLVIMTGIGFTLGVVFGLLLQLPIDTLPAGSAADPGLSGIAHSTHGGGRFRRSVVLSNFQGQGFNGGVKQNNDNARVSGGEELKRKVGASKSTFDSSHIKSSSNSSSTHGNAGREGSLDIIKVHQDNTAAVKPGGAPQTASREDLAYLAKLVDGIVWSPYLEASCPRPFPPDEVDSWRLRTAKLDVVKVEEGCGRMQNRLVTFRDSSRACARYRLNTDQIQGEVFSHYLARLLNISHVPPTLLARVDSRAKQWRSVHLPLSLAQWADGRLVVLTRFIDGLNPALIPPEFRGEDEKNQQEGTAKFNVNSIQSSGTLPPDFRPRLTPTVAGLGGKSQGELCQLLQWSDLIIFDYLTANLDRVINNMFNRQWNDQMMANPAHNLEQRDDGALVFLDNESGLFHGYRLLPKYASFHRSLLGSLCVFRKSTVTGIRRLRDSRSVGAELRELFAQGEPELNSHLAPIPERNIKVLQERIGDVAAQIDACERAFGGAVSLGGEDSVRNLNMASSQRPGAVDSLLKQPSKTLSSKDIHYQRTFEKEKYR